MPRSIIHLGIDSFFAAVEIIDHPGYRFKPVIVTAPSESGAEVCSLSGEAARRGVLLRMKQEEALRICPKAVVAPARFKRYIEISECLHALCEEYTRLVEPVGLDETFLDVTDEAASAAHGPRVAGELKRRVKAELHLNASAGVGPNKLLARLASVQVRPSGFAVVDPGRVAEFLKPVPVKSVWGIGAVAQQALSELGVKTVGELSRVSRKELTQKFGKAAQDYERIGRGEDHQPVVPDRGPKSLSHEITFPEPRAEASQIHRTLRELSRALEGSLWKRNLRCLTVTLKVKHPESSTIRRSVTLLSPVNEAQPILAAASRLFDRSKAEGKPVERLGIIVTHLIPEGAPYQLSLF